MNSSRTLWAATALVGLLTTALLIFGLGYAIHDMMFSQPRADAGAPQVEVPENQLLSREKIQIVALGDSLTKGTGDQTGKGYVGTVQQLLKTESDKPVYVLGNFAVNGYRTDQLLRDLDTQQGVVNALSQANLILLTIGANDLFQLAREQFDVSADIDAAAIEQRLPQTIDRLKTVFEKLEEINSQATILYVSLYNPFGDMDQERKASHAIQKFNFMAYELTNQYPNMIVVPTFDLFVSHPDSYIFSDHFHPNAEGYQRIAERILKVLK